MICETVARHTYLSARWDIRTDNNADYRNSQHDLTKKFPIQKIFLRSFCLRQWKRPSMTGRNTFTDQVCGFQQLTLRAHVRALDRRLSRIHVAQVELDPPPSSHRR